MDEKDFVFINKPLNSKEEKAFSDFLKLRKTKTRQTRLTQKAKVYHNQQHKAAAKVFPDVDFSNNVWKGN